MASAKGQARLRRTVPAPRVRLPAPVPSRFIVCSGVDSQVRRSFLPPPPLSGSLSSAAVDYAIRTRVCTSLHTW